MNQRPYRSAAAGIVALALAACASAPPPQTSETVGMAKAAADAARQQDAEVYAPELLEMAESKIARAEDARRREDFVDSTRLAQQATLDAKLAAVEADLAQTRLMVEELEASVELLEREIAVR